MPRESDDPIDSFLVDVLQEYEDHLQKTGCWADGRYYPEPSLRNDILPMFRQRWVTGPTQQTATIFSNMYPALQLASRFLTEDWALPWFCRLTFGSRHADPRNKGVVHIERTPEMFMPGALAQVKANLNELGKVITFMFKPRGHEREARGTMYPDKTAIPFYREIPKTDWPPDQDRPRSSQCRNQRPCIALNPIFQTFFLEKFPKASLQQRYRFWFLLALTLGHEIAHSYWQWLHDRPTEEPLWCRSERRNELGFSWEYNVIGRLIQPIKKRDETYMMLFSIRLEPYTSAHEYRKTMEKVWCPAPAEYTLLDAQGKKRRWPLLRPNSHRYGRIDRFLGYPCDSFVCAIHAIPMAWTVAWFHEGEWSKQRRAVQDVFSPSSLSSAFVLIYERKPDIAHIWRPIVRGEGWL